jgi:phenylacetate-CoA ligase
MDILDHVVKGVQEFQVDLRYLHPILRIVPEPNENNAELAQRINRVWPDAFMLEFVGHHQLVRVGRLAKFRHVVRA